MEKTQLAAHVIAASLPRNRKFDAMKDENYWHKDLIKFLQQKISMLERKCGTLEKQCQIEGGENKSSPWNIPKDEGEIGGRTIEKDIERYWNKNRNKDSF